MRLDTARRHANAYQTPTGPKTWQVKAKFAADAALSVFSSGLTYRQAKATARSLVEAGNWASVERMVSDAQFLAALGPCGK